MTSEVAVIRDELSRTGFHNQTSSAALVCMLVLRARQIAADPEFQPFKPDTVFFGSTAEQERFRWAAITATLEWLGGRPRDYGRPVEASSGN